ncbi:MAG: phage portal protein [Sphaerochaeta sp.]
MLINLGMLLDSMQQDGTFTQRQNMADDTSELNFGADFIQWVIGQWGSDPRLKEMMTGQEYYENDNDIHRRHRSIYGYTGEEETPSWLTNNRIAHPFLRKMVRQKIGYLLGHEVRWDTDNTTLKGRLEDYIDKDFQRIIKQTATNAVVQGIGWLQAYYDDNGRLQFKRIPGSEVIPFWGDNDHTQLNAVIRVYETAKWTGLDVEQEDHAELYTTDGVIHYVKGIKSGTWAIDENVPVTPNFVTAAEDGSEEGRVWERIPFIPIKYNPEEQPLLHYVKDIIDDYDRRVSDMSNSLEDEPDKIKIVKNYDGTNKREFIRNLAELHTAFVRADGGLDTVDTSISGDAAEKHLDRLRKDLYEAASGVDTQSNNIGDASGVALRFLYSDLDLDCQIFGGELSWALDRCLWFVLQDLGMNEDDVKVDWKYTTSTIINETERISNIKNSQGLLSDRTLIAAHPLVNNVDDELKQIAAEDEAKAESINELYSFNPDQQVQISQQQGPDTVTQTLSGAGKTLAQASQQATTEQNRQGAVAAANASSEE